MLKEQLKKNVGWEVIKYIKPNSIVGVGSGTTITYFIEALSTIKHKIKGVISSSILSSYQLNKFKIPILDLNIIKSVDIYIDSADEINHQMQMIKGGGAALTNEKIIAAVSKKFICIVDISKYVTVLGKFPLPIEVIPLAKNFVIHELINLGGEPKYRNGIITDNNNIIIDVFNFKIFNPIKLEEYINNIPGVVTVGLFARQNADMVLISTMHGIKIKK